MVQDPIQDHKCPCVLVSFTLEQFLSLSLSFMILAPLKNEGQHFIEYSLI